MRTERSAARLRTRDTPSKAPIRIVKIPVSPIRTIVTACSFGVLGLLEDSTILIIWLMKVSSGLTVTFAVSVSLRTCEPPITSSPGAFRTAVDSPVRRDSSTIAIPSRTCASMGTVSLFSRRIRSSLRSSLDGVGTIRLEPSSMRIFLLDTSISSLRRLFAVFFA